MVNNEDRFRALHEKQAELEGRLEATRQEVQAARQEAKANSDNLMKAMAEMRAEMMELLRLNRPSPPVMGSPPEQGGGAVTPEQGECSNMQERIRLRTTIPQAPNPVEAQRAPVKYGNQNNGQIFRPRAEFPDFDYANPRIWTRRVERGIGDNYLYIITDLCCGGNLYERLSRGPLSEPSAAIIFQQLMMGREYSEKVDVWSAWVILYIMHAGVPTFYDDTLAKTFLR